MPTEKSDRDWDVLLVGGPSGCGKSSLSYPLAARLGLALTEADDLFIAAQTCSTPVTQPDLYFFDHHPEAAAEMAPEEILAAFIATCRVMSAVLKAVIANHLETDRPLLLEGDYLLPELMAQVAAEVDGAHRVRAVYLIEEDESRIVANFLAREPQAGVQAKRARVSWLFGQWLLAECRRTQLPAVNARPFATLPDRVRAAVG